MDQTLEFVRRAAEGLGPHGLIMGDGFRDHDLMERIRDQLKGFATPLYRARHNLWWTYKTPEAT